MSGDNQDYFKRAGRSIGRRGPRSRFKEELGQERAELRQEQLHPLNHPGRFAGTRISPQALLHRESANGGQHERQPLEAHPPAAADEARPRRARSAGQSEHAFGGRGATEGAAPSQRGAEEESSPGNGWAEGTFGIPASEEEALGHEHPPYEREREAHRSQALQRLPWDERLALTFPRTFRFAGGLARLIERPMRRSLLRLAHLGAVARENERARTRDTRE